MGNVGRECDISVKIIHNEYITRQHEMQCKDVAYRLRKLYGEVCEEEEAVGSTRSDRGALTEARPIATLLILFGMRRDRRLLPAPFRAFFA